MVPSYYPEISATMKRVKLYQTTVRPGEPFEFYLPGLEESIYVLRGHKIEIEVTDIGESQMALVTVSRLTSDGYDARSDEWFPDGTPAIHSAECQSDRRSKGS